MLIYEVNLEIKANILETFQHWLQDHIRQMLTNPGFAKAQTYRVHEIASSTNVHLVVQYYVDTMINLNNYFSCNAQKMRAEGLSKFGDDFKATRRILLES